MGSIEESRAVRSVDSFSGLTNRAY